MSLAAVSALLVTGCSADSNDSESGSAPSTTGFECAAPGDASDSVKVSGDHGLEVSITADTPLKVKQQETTVVDKGEGRKVTEDDVLKVHLSLFNADDATPVDSQVTQIGLDPEQVPAWIGNALACGTTASRLVSVVPVGQIWDNVAETGPEGLSQDGSVVLVFDVIGVEPGRLDESEILKKAEGAAAELPAGFPEVSVETAETGEPTITIPEGAKAPEKLTIAPLIVGDGEQVQPGDRVYVNYRGVIWRTGEEFDSSWSRGQAIDFLTTGVIGGFQKALEGQTVGSQIISIVPAEDGGYGAQGLEGMGHQPDDVMVFVLDILGTVHAE